VLNNNGTLNATVGGDFVRGNANAAHAINNAGTWNVSGADTISNVDNCPLTIGAVSVTSGTFSLNGRGTSTGSFVSLTDAKLKFGGTGPHDLNAGSSVSGAGTVEIGNGTWNFNAGTYSVAGTTVLNGDNGTANFNAAARTNALALTGGFLLGSGIVSVSGDLTWTGARWAGRE
jgi:hypothetical protein